MNVYIDSVRLIGCQGYRDVTLRFSRGLNIIKADDNSVGKSIFFKMLREAATPGYWGREGRKQLIRWGSACAEMQFWFSDRTECVFKLFPTARQYLFRDLEAGTEFVSEEPPREFLERMSIIASDLYIANVLTTQGDLLFVESSGATDRALLTLLTNHDGMENLVARTTEVIKATEEKRRSLGSLQSILEGEFRTLAYVDPVDLYEKKEMLDTLIPALEVLEVVVDTLRLMGEVGRVSEQLEAVEGLVGMAQALSLISGIASSMKGLEEKETVRSWGEILAVLEILQGVPFVDGSAAEELELLKLALEVTGELEQRLRVAVQSDEEIQRLCSRAKEIREFLAGSTRRCYCEIYGKEVFFDAGGCVPSGD